MVNEVALGLLYGMFGFKIAFIYLLSGEIIAIASGIIIGKIGLEKYIETYVFSVKINTVEEASKTYRKKDYIGAIENSGFENIQIIN